MTELFLNTHPVHDGRGSGSNDEGRNVLRHTLLSFQRPPGGGRRVSPPPPSALLVSQKKPLIEGPETMQPRGGRSRLLLRGGSLRDAKQERPGSIARKGLPDQARVFPVSR